MSKVTPYIFRTPHPPGKAMHPYSLQLKALRILKYSEKASNFVYPAPHLVKYTGYPLFIITVFKKGKKSNLSKEERNELAKLVDILIETYGGKV